MKQSTQIVHLVEVIKLSQQRKDRIGNDGDLTHIKYRLFLINFSQAYEEYLSIM